MPNMLPCQRIAWVPIPQRVSEQASCCRHAAGMTAHYLSHDIIPLKQGETAPGSRRRRGRGTSPGADGRTTSGLA